MVALALLAILCLAGFAAWFPAAAVVVWILVLETSPDGWLAAAGRETVIAVMKAAGLVLAALLGLRFGWRRDRFNPSLAFVVMFFAGAVHGLYPGLSLAGSLRSLAGSAAPYLFGFVRVPPVLARSIIRACICGPAVTVGCGVVTQAAGLTTSYTYAGGAFRLGATGDPAFLAGFTLIAVYAGFFEILRGPGGREALWLGANFAILLLTGARAPLAAALFVGLVYLVFRPRLVMFAAAGAAVSLAVLCSNTLSFIRVVDLAQLGQAGNLSNRELVWPYFSEAFLASPFVGWGVGAGKVIVPLGSKLFTLIGTNAAHDEYLRIGAEGGVLGLGLLIGLMAGWVVRGTRAMPAAQAWLLRAVFIAFAAHSTTDNTLIATTSSVFFIWVSAVFASAKEPVKAPV